MIACSLLTGCCQKRVAKEGSTIGEPIAIAKLSELEAVERVAKELDMAVMDMAAIIVQEQAAHKRELPRLARSEIDRTLRVPASQRARVLSPSLPVTIGTEECDAAWMNRGPRYDALALDYTEWTMTGPELRGLAYYEEVRTYYKACHWFEDTGIWWYVKYSDSCGAERYCIHPQRLDLWTPEGDLDGDGDIDLYDFSIAQRMDAGDLVGGE